MRKKWDIFCRVIDNYGDIGVCWRLARQLSGEHGQRVRLWLDDLASLAPLCPKVATDIAVQTLAGVEIRHWTEDFPPVEAADVVIEAFACALPAAYEQLMAQSLRPPLWINLEYLSAEDWIGDCHGLASPHPTLPLVKYFWFPGFTAKSGGLLREADLIARRDAYVAALPRQEGLQLSLFCYDSAPVAALLDAWASDEKPIRCLVAAGKPQQAVRAHLGEAVAGIWQHGRLTLEALPFVAQEDFDPLLWRSDLNFVRGEDSFVRAQWAALPLVWQIYPQQEGAHLEKLRAFLDLYCADMPPGAAMALRGFHALWNGTAVDAKALKEAWRALHVQLPVLKQHARLWCDKLVANPPAQATESNDKNATAKMAAPGGDLATGLVNFAAVKL